MSHIKNAILSVNEKREAALIPFLTAGFPDTDIFVDLALAILDAGGDLLEIGIPFSDPLADGPTIQASSQVALSNGINVSKTLNLCREIRKKTDKPLIIMTYINPVLAYGLKEFARSCRETGIDGVIIPDLPPEEASEWKRYAREEGVDTIFLMAPTTNKERFPLINGYTSGFIYYVSTTGVTGSTNKLPDELVQKLENVRKLSRWPVAVGFGISTPEQVAMLAPHADGIIVGSAIIREIQKTPKNKVIEVIKTMIKDLKAATCLSSKWHNMKAETGVS